MKGTATPESPPVPSDCSIKFHVAWTESKTPTMAHGYAALTFLFAVAGGCGHVDLDIK